MQVKRCHLDLLSKLLFHKSRYLFCRFIVAIHLALVEQMTNSSPLPRSSSLPSHLHRLSLCCRSLDASLTGSYIAVGGFEFGTAL